MPTGYTAGVANGTITDFTEYALQCARNFGACVTLRDDPISSEIPEFTPSEWNAEKLAEAEAELSRFLAMTELERRELHAKEHAKNIEYAERQILEKQAERTRYEAMLEKAREFKSPSTEHDGYAKFLVTQLTESIDFDCDTSYYDKLKQPVSFNFWKAEKLRKLRRDIEYHGKAQQEEVSRTESRNRWVRQLKEALGLVSQTEGVTQ